MQSKTFERNSTADSESRREPRDGGREVIVLRVAEIFLKGRNRGSFWKALIHNARRLLGDLDGVSVESHYLRAQVSHPPELRQACIDRLDRLFGLASMAPAIAVDADLDAVSRAAVDIARRMPGASFKIESKRRDKSFALASPEISRTVGSAVAAATGRPVDVHQPDQIIHVEIGPQSYVFGEILPGPGGLPVGTSGRVALLLSGGIDSPVAGWSAMRRGCQASAIYFHSFPYTGDKTKEKVLDLARHLARWQGPMNVHVVHFTDVQKQLREHGRAEFAVLLYRRMMMRTASRLADAEASKALVTGENLGQVASQTVENLAVIEDAATLPILRPLITHDKLEIVKQAQRIGTYETSILPYDDCCSLFVPKHPATKARIRDLQRAEEGLDVDALADQLCRDTEHITVSG
ncbi:MAG: tRNA 4-thiouridine(8) synthase ThiI [Proteobacteria bacterium]|nr:tRNA 4-thiouridine(8) synthase ThiI [Pseudomonadota bacterium]